MAESFIEPNPFAGLRRALHRQVIAVLFIAVTAEVIGLLTWTLPLVGASALIAGAMALLLNTALSVNIDAGSASIGRGARRHRGINRAVTEIDASASEMDVPRHPLADQFTSPKTKAPGRCMCGAVLPAMEEWDDYGNPWAYTTCQQCGRGFVDEDDYIAVYDDGLDLSEGQ